MKILTPEATIADMARFWNNLRFMDKPMSFEIISDNDRIFFGWQFPKIAAILFTLPDSIRDRHLYVVGKSGTGKSTLIEQIARRDI